MKFDYEGFEKWLLKYKGYGDREIRFCGDCKYYRLIGCNQHRLHGGCLQLWNFDKLNEAWFAPPHIQRTVIVRVPKDLAKRYICYFEFGQDGTIKRFEFEGDDIESLVNEYSVCLERFF